MYVYRHGRINSVRVNILTAYMQDYIRIAVVEGSVSLLRPLSDGKLLYSPYLRPNCVAGSLPSRVLVSCMFPNVLLELQRVCR